MLDLGDVEILSVNIIDVNGLPANATSVALTIVEPDGSVVSVPTVAPTITGQYDYSYTTTKVGRHSFRWVATGANANAYTGIFEVRPLQDLTFVSLGEVKDYLGIPTTHTSDDGKLRTVIVAACQVAEFICGPVALRTLTEYPEYDGMDFVQTRYQPVASVTSVTEVYGNTTQALNEVQLPDLTNDVWGFFCDKDTGIISRRSGGYPIRFLGGSNQFRYYGSYVKIVYVAGRTTTPGNIQLGTMELIGHLWRQSQLNSQGRRPRTNQAEPVVVVMGYAVPNRVIEMLQATPRIPSIG